MKRLWECKHTYYCSKRNYFNNDTTLHFETWEDFAEESNGEDLDYNLVVRFDWYEGEGYELPEYDGDDSKRFAKLWIFYLGQRKGLFRTVSIDVCRNDEPAVVEWLRPRLQRLMEIWEPIAPQVTP